MKYALTLVIFVMDVQVQTPAIILAMEYAKMEGWDLSGIFAYLAPTVRTADHDRSPPLATPLSGSALTSASSTSHSIAPLAHSPLQMGM